MKKRKYLLVVSVACMIIGFAAVSATLYLNGRTDIGVNQKDFDVYFSEAILDGEDKSSELISADKKSIIYEITNLQKVGDISHLNYEITNNSSQYDLDIQLSCEGNNDLIDYVNQLDQTRISAKAKEKGVLTVQLKQTVLEETTVTFTCQINASAVERTEANIPENPKNGLGGFLVNQNNEPLASKTVALIEEDIYLTKTDNLGGFYIDGLEDGNYEILYHENTIEELQDKNGDELKNSSEDKGKIDSSSIPEIIELENGNKIIKAFFEVEQEERYQIALDANGGTLEQTTYEVIKNHKMGDLPTPTKENSPFIGWYFGNQLITKETIALEKIETLVAKYEEKKSAIDYIEDLAKTDTVSLAYDGTTDNNLRYVGSNPNNYVKFNDELWRIIGVMNNIKDSDKKVSSHLKIIRASSMGTYAWDNKVRGSGSAKTEFGGNDWSDSKIKDVLNAGAYYARINGRCPYGSDAATTACNFSSTGLSETAKSMISNIVWNLGGIDSSATAQNIYKTERGTNVYSGWATTWIGQVGLMYASDYGFSVGDYVADGKKCLTLTVANYGGTNHTCYRGSWLFKTNMTQWIMNVTPSNSYYVYTVARSGILMTATKAYEANAIFPVVYLNTDVSIESGSGTSTEPFILK